MNICGHAVTFSVLVSVPGNTVYDTATYGTDAYDGGTEAWLDVNPLTLSTRVERRTNEASVWRADIWDPDRVLDPTFSPYSRGMGEGSRVQLLVDGVALWAGRVAPGGWEYELEDYTATISGMDDLGYLAGWVSTDAPYPGERTPDRFARIVGAVPNPPGLTTTGTGALLGPVTMTGDALSQMIEVNRSERGWFWSTPTGVRAATWDAVTIPAPEVTFTDDPTVPVVYEGVRLSQTAVGNVISADRVRATGEEPSPITVTVAESVGRYGPRTVSEPNLQVADDPGVRTWAELELSRAAWARTLPTEMTVRVHDQLPYGATTLDALLGLDMLDGVRVRITARGSPSQSWDCFIVGIAHDISPEWWVSTVELDSVTDPNGGLYDAAVYDANNYTSART